MSPLRRRGGRCVAAAVLVSAAAGPAAAQPDVAARTIVPCTGQTVSGIVIVTQPPYTDRLPDRLEFLRAGVRRFHQNTRESVVRNFLLMRAGEPCTELARAESERVLRAQPFLVDARVIPYDDGAGGVRLEVETRDEFSLVASTDVRFEGEAMRGLRLGESNLGGEGIFTALTWRNGIAYRDFIGGEFVHYQAFGRPNVFVGELAQAERGHRALAELRRPYLTDLQRVGWRIAIGSDADYVTLRNTAGPAGQAVALERDFAALGGVFRIGRPGSLKLLGASLTYEDDVVGRELVTIGADGFGAERPPLPADFDVRDLRVTRVNLLAGMRRLRFRRVEGFDALTGAQDVRLGTQAELLVGYGVPWFGAGTEDLFVRHGLYVGAGGQRDFVAAESRVEARRDARSREWDGILASGRAAWYHKPNGALLTLAELEWAAGFSMRVPWQLSMADPEVGMAGYRESRLPGARRVIARLEQRWIPAPAATVGDIGVAAFGEVGRLHAGDAPFARTSPTLGSIGVSLLAAVPRRSRRLFRIDAAMPVGPDPSAGFELRLTLEDATRAFFVDGRDMRRARRRAVPTRLFQFP